MRGPSGPAAGPSTIPQLAETPSDRLRRKLQLASGPFVAASSRLVSHPRIRDLWPEYLMANYAVIRATVPLMETALARATALAGSDPVAAGVARYLAEHIEEERDHDQWLLEDLELIGVEPALVLKRVPSATIAALVGSQYYWVLHVHPVAVLGYLAFMEGFPPAKSLIEDLIVRTGFPRESFRTLAEHGELDQHHRDELDRTIDALPLSRQDEAILGLVTIAGVQLLARFEEEIVESVPEAPQP